MSRFGGTAGAIVAGILLTLVSTACAEENGVESTESAVESMTSTTAALLIDRVLLPDSEELSSSFAADPDGSTGESLVFSANPQDPDAGYVQVRLWDEEPSALASESIDIGGVQGRVDVTESVGQLAFPSGDQWVLVVSGGLDMDHLRTVGESAVVTGEAASESRLSVETSGLPEGWVSSTFPQLGIERVEVHRPDLRDAHPAELRPDLQLDVAPVLHHRLGRPLGRAGGHPAIEPLGQRRILTEVDAAGLDLDGQRGDRLVDDLLACPRVRRAATVRVTRMSRPVVLSRPAYTWSCHLPGPRWRAVPLTPPTVPSEQGTVSNTVSTRLTDP